MKYSNEWTFDFNCDCPECKCAGICSTTRILWDGWRLGAEEPDTERSTSVEVICPECRHEFTVDCQY